MNVKLRWVRIAAIWLAGMFTYITLSWLFYRLFVAGIRHWVYHGETHWGVEFESHALARPAFQLSVFWGALYASALAKPSHFGGPLRILKYLASSFCLSLIGNAIGIAVLYLRLPDFRYGFAVSAYIVTLIALFVISFVGALGFWIRLAFAAVPQRKGEEGMSVVNQA